MRIVYIDENEAQRGYFLRSADNSESFEEEDIVLMHPKNTIEVMLEWIFSESPDGIVIDYKLGDDGSMIEYTGLELLEAIQRQRYGYPCAVITSFLDQALEDKVSGWRIVSKKKVFIDTEEEDLEESENFFKRLRNDIEVFHHAIMRSREEHITLSEKLNSGEINAYEYQKLLNLDTFLEKAMTGDEAFPEHIHTRIADKNPFLELLDRAEKIIGEIEAEKESDE